MSPQRQPPSPPIRPPPREIGAVLLGDLRAIKAQGADVVVFRTRSRESSLVIDEMLAMGTDVTPFVLAHNGGEARLTINGAAHNELIH